MQLYRFNQLKQIHLYLNMNFQIMIVVFGKEKVVLLLKDVQEEELLIK